MLRLAVFASGYGSNLEAIYHSISEGRLRGVKLLLVLSNNSNSGALAFAARVGIEGVHLSLKTCNSDEHELEMRMVELLRERQIDIIALAGYMKKLPPHVLSEYSGRIVNIHPALLPDFGGVGMFGLNVHTAVLQAGKKISGATVHLVEGEYDSGKILVQESCPVLEGDTPELLAQRVRTIEHRILPQGIQIIADTIPSHS